jgi:hypothetical protein
MSFNAFEYCSWFLKHLGKVRFSCCFKAPLGARMQWCDMCALQLMILVVFFFVLLTAAALLDAYGPLVHGPDRGQAAGSLLGLLIFFALVCMLK